MLKDDVLAIVTQKEPDAPFAAMNVDEIEQVIKNYCNIPEVPDGLKYTWANMALDLARYELARSKGPEETTDITTGGRITSIKAGDTSYGIGAGTSETVWQAERSSHQAKLDSITMGYTRQLNGYRRLRGYRHGNQHIES